MDLSQLSPTISISLVATFITGMWTFVNMTISKDQEIARWRSEWIKDVTNALARLFAEVELLLRLAECEKKPLDDPGLKQFRSGNKDHYKALNESLYAVRLKLDPKKNENILAQLDNLYNAFYIPTCANLAEVHKIQKDLVAMSQNLHEEIWIKIRNGEQLFHFLRLLTFFVGALALVALFVVVYLHLYDQGPRAG